MARGDLGGLSADDLLGIFADVPSRDLARDQLSGDGLPLVELAVMAGLEGSKARARTLIEGGGLSLNNHKLTDASARVGLAQTVEGKLLVLRKGKKEFCLIRVVG